MKTALSIAGSDCSGGAGIQADIKTMTVCGVYAMSAITSLTAQNTTGIRSIIEVPAEFLAEQLDMIFEDIFPDSVKLGMLPSCELIETAAERLTHYKAKNIVCDPVMVSSSGCRLISEAAAEMLYDRIFTIADIVTPNIPEAEIISRISIKTKSDAECAARKMCEKFGCSVLIKGGHFDDNADDYFFSSDAQKWLCGVRIKNKNTHGTGCTLSSAIAANLAMGDCLEDSVKSAKEYVTGAIADGLDLGKGSGPMNHAYILNKGVR